MNAMVNIRNGKRSVIRGRLLAILLVAAMCFSLLPSTAFAASTGYSITVIHENVNTLTELGLSATYWSGKIGDAANVTTIAYGEGSTNAVVVSNIDNTKTYQYVLKNYWQGYTNEVIKQKLESIAITSNGETVTYPVAYPMGSGNKDTQLTVQQKTDLGISSGTVTFYDREVATSYIGFTLANFTPTADIVLTFNWQEETVTPNYSVTATVADGQNEYGTIPDGAVDCQGKCKTAK